MLSDYDNNQILVQFEEECTGLTLHSKAYLASELEKKVTRKITLKSMLEMFEDF